MSCVNKRLGGAPSANHISKIYKRRIKNKPVPQLKVLAVIIFVWLASHLMSLHRLIFFNLVWR